jgi:hypothetical protein
MAIPAGHIVRLEDADTRSAVCKQRADSQARYARPDNDVIVVPAFLVLKLLPVSVFVRESAGAGARRAGLDMQVVKLFHFAAH